MPHTLRRKAAIAAAKTSQPLSIIFFKGAKPVYPYSSAYTDYSHGFHVTVYSSRDAATVKKAQESKKYGGLPCFFSSGSCSAIKSFH